MTKKVENLTDKPSESQKDKAKIKEPIQFGEFVKRIVRVKPEPKQAKNEGRKK